MRGTTASSYTARVVLHTKSTRCNSVCLPHSKGGQVIIDTGFVLNSDRLKIRTTLLLSEWLNGAPICARWDRGTWQNAVICYSAIIEPSLSVHGAASIREYPDLKSFSVSFTLINSSNHRSQNVKMHLISKSRAISGRGPIGRFRSWSF